MWLSLIVLLFGAMMMDVASGQCDCRIYVDYMGGSEVHNEDMSLSEFTVDINVENVCDLYGFGFTLDYAPYVSILAGVSAVEGPFLKQGGMTVFTKKIKHFEGEVLVGCSLLFNVSGVSGSGTLATIKFSIVEAGNSPLDLIDVQLVDSPIDGSIDDIPCDIVAGSYLGPTADVKYAYTKGWWFLPIAMAGDTATVHSKVCNYGAVPLDVKVKYDYVRRDGRVTTFWAGQTYRTTAPESVYLYCNEFTADYVEWSTNGVPPYLDAPDDGNYIDGTFDAAFMAWFGFEDISLDGRLIDTVTLEGYTDGPYTGDVDFDAYDGNFAWHGSLYATGAPAWVTPRWLDPGECVSTINPDTRTEAGLNGFQVLLYYYDPTNVGGSFDIVDCLRLRVDFASVDPVDPPVFTIAPGDCVCLNASSWILAEEDVGFYRGTATCYYTYNEFTWIAGKREYPLWLWVWKPWPWW